MGYKESSGSKKVDSGMSGPGGGNVIAIDNRCLSCSGQATTVLAGFKIACLQYQGGRKEGGFNSQCYHGILWFDILEKCVKFAFSLLEI